MIDFKKYILEDNYWYEGYKKGTVNVYFIPNNISERPPNIFKIIMGYGLHNNEEGTLMIGDRYD
jgi:hypothetical protein